MDVAQAKAFLKGGGTDDETPDESDAILPQDKPGRPAVTLPNGQVATVRSIGVGDERGEWVIPTIVDGKPVDNETATRLWKAGKNAPLGGPFKTIEEGNDFAQKFHEQEANRLGLTPDRRPQVPPSLRPTLPEDRPLEKPDIGAQPGPPLLPKSILPPGVPDLVAQRQAKYLQETQEPGVPLDVKTGASPWDRLLVGSMRDKRNGLIYLQNKYGSANVRMDKEGDFIFRVPDEKGQSKDIKFDPEGVSLGDFAALTSAIPEIAGTLFSIRGGRAIPALSKLKGAAALTRDVMFGAAGGEAAGALKDIAATTAERGPIRATQEIPTVATERGKMAASDVVLGYGGYGLGRFFKFAGAPFSGKQGPVQFAAKEAQDYFESNPRYGIKVPLTASEMTGSPLLGRAEVYTEIQPGGFGPLRALKEQQERELLGLQRQITGIGPPVADEEILERVSHGVATELSGLEEAVQAARQGISASAESQVLSEINQLSPVRRQLYRSLVGQQARAAAIAERNAAMGTANGLYEQARQIHGLADKDFDANPLKKRLEKILSELPSVKVTKELPTGVEDRFGRPILKPTDVTEILKTWPPEKLLPRLREILSKEDPRVSYWDLKNMRRDVYDDMTKHEGVPSMSTHYLAKIGQAITATMDDVKKEISQTTPEFGKAIEKADAYWKKAVVPFDRPGVTEWFRRVGEPGYIPDDELVTRIFTTAKSPSVSLQNWQVAKETLGQNSVAWQNLKRSFFDHILEANRLGDQTIDARGFVQSLQDLRTKYREIFDETVGPKFDSLLKEARFVEAGADLSKPPPKISQSDLSALLSDRSPTAAKLRDFIAKQAKLDDVYRNDLLRMAGSKQPINPWEFVDRLVASPKTTVQQLAQILGRLKGKPALIEDIQTKALERFFQESGRRVGPSDVARAFAGETSKVASNLGMVTFLEEDPAMATKLKMLLGPERFKDLNQFANLVAGTEYKYAAGGYQMAGAFAATHAVKSLEQLQFLKFTKPAVANWFVAKLLVNPAFRAWASRAPKNPDPAYLSLFLTSPAFLREVSHDFPDNSASAFVSELKDGLDQWLRGQKQTESQPPTDEAERRKFFQDYLRQRRQQSIPQ